MLTGLVLQHSLFLHFLSPGMHYLSFRVRYRSIIIAHQLFTQSRYCSILWLQRSFYKVQHYHHGYLAYGTRVRSARGSQNRAILSIICPFTGNRAFWLCVNDIVVDLSRRKDATKVFIREVSTTKYIINMALPSSYT